MCSSCNILARNQGAEDPTKTLALRQNYSVGWRLRIEKAVISVTTSALISGYAAGTVSNLELQAFIKAQLEEQLGTDWNHSYVIAAVTSAYVQGSMRLQNPIDADKALGLFRFQGSFDNAIEVHSASIFKSIDRSAQLLTEGAVNASQDARDESQADRIAVIAAELSRIATQGIPPAEAASAAETLIVSTHAESIIDYYEVAGVTALLAQVEFVTAGDDRVCPDCESLAGNTYLLIDARGIIPVHVGCRCSWFPKL